MRRKLRWSESRDDGGCDNIMDRYRMNECQSCNVMDGHWLMYEQPQFRGKMMYMRPGEYRNFRDMGMSCQSQHEQHRHEHEGQGTFRSLFVISRNNCLQYHHLYLANLFLTIQITFFQITFYEEKNFQGRSYECMNDCSDMSSS
ncbi:hypothetical protein F7725_002416 [Dissostichus mawsoni]|uniref:Beta/gamma crystallin 'Greek key' domain-containing protein n=1 Tax=Dissostichus mawsoni TaxID=36200 RepID=A0A7J5Y4J3_DISMA|nr:hypothetical protein F7725_002416 [Dissostichus mawsoni]